MQLVPELIESYIVEVCRFVPKEQRKEIAQDLRDGIAEEVYERADERGEEPNEDDARIVLERFGHPLKVAGSYQPQKYLIGPDMYPVMMQTMRVVLAVVAVILVVAFYVLGQAQGWQIGPIDLFWMTLEVLVWTVFAIFLVFAGLEMSGEKLNWYDSWSAKSLSPNSMSTINRSDVVTNIVSEGFFLLWWNDVVVLQNFLPEGTLTLTLAPIWQDYFWPLNIVFLALFSLHIYTLVTGVWHRWTLLTEVFLSAAFLGLGVVLLTGGPLLLAEGLIAEDQLVNSEPADNVVRGALLVVLGFTVWDLWAAFKNLRGRVYGKTAVEMSV